MKFDDLNKSQVMDIKTAPDADWKTLSHSDVKLLLKNAKKPSRPTIPRNELNNLIDTRAETSAAASAVLISDFEDDHYSDAVVIPDDDNTDENRSLRLLSFTPMLDLLGIR